MVGGKKYNEMEMVSTVSWLTALFLISLATGNWLQMMSARS